jgi:hypothetical protein
VAAHPERIKAQRHRRRYEADQRRAYYEAHREQSNQRSRAYYEANKAAIRARRAQVRKALSEQLNITPVEVAARLQRAPSSYGT